MNNKGADHDQTALMGRLICALLFSYAIRLVFSWHGSDILPMIKERSRFYCMSYMLIIFLTHSTQISKYF